MVTFCQDWSGVAEIYVAVSISWMGHTKKQTNTHTKKQKHDDMLSCCTTKNVWKFFHKSLVGKKSSRVQLSASHWPCFQLKPTISGDKEIQKVYIR